MMQAAEVHVIVLKNAIVAIFLHLVFLEKIYFLNLPMFDKI